MPNEIQRPAAALPSVEPARLPSVSPEQFIRKWTASNLSERSAAQQHFLDLCNLLGEPTPAEADPTGETFTFEKGGTTATGGHGWADVWKKECFAWEYKGPGKDLTAAYVQLKKYADMLENPPLLIVSDTKRIEIHTNFTNTVKIVHVVEIGDLADPAKREKLRAAFSAPERLRPGVTRQQVTTEAAQKFSQLAHALRAKDYEPQRVAHFLNRLIFCMFAEDVGLLPNRLFTKLVTASVAHPETFQENARQLFAGMAKGGSVAFEVIEWFNGGLFDDDATLPLDAAELKDVLKCAELDWSNIEPSIFGTLFERGLDPDKRSQQGAHYTDPDTIMKIVRPVVLEPWQREWETERQELAKQIERAKKTVSEAAKRRYFGFLHRLHQFRVLDPACGSGNFLYLALRGLKDIEKRVILEAEALGLPLQFPQVGPEAVLGIEVNAYAAELARVTIWIGEIQWMIENGFGAAKNPILKPLNQIECKDALIEVDGIESSWPSTDVIIGNPPFLGSRKLEGELTKPYVDAIRKAHKGRIERGSDLVCYWVAKAWELVESGKVARAGLVATNSITSGTSRKVLEPVSKARRISHAWPDEPWVLDGAAVRVAIICFTHDAPPIRKVNDVCVPGIGPDLQPIKPQSAGFDPSLARALSDNEGIAFQGVVPRSSVQKKEAARLKLPPATFVLAGGTARAMLTAGGNPNGRPNTDVVFPYLVGDDVTGRPLDRFIVDFRELTEPEAAGYEAPFQYIRPVRGHRAAMAQPEALETWWQLWRPRPEMRAALRGLSRFIVTSRVSKHRVFAWAYPPTVVDNAAVAFARDDDLMFGVLQSAIHVAWASRMGSSLEDRPRYTSTTTFGTFPLPWGRGTIVPQRLLDQISVAARDLNAARENWLNPSGWVRQAPEVISGWPSRVIPVDDDAAKRLKNRTLTKLYNARPAWLQHAHETLDKAVAAAYGWEWPLTDGEVRNRLFKLNQERT